MEHIYQIMSYLDAEEHFGYVQLLNNQDQQQLGVSSNIQTVLIIDNETNYFNASKLFTTFNKTNYTLAGFMKTKIFNNLCELIVPTEPYYTIDKTKETRLYCGIYFHPSLLSHVLISINPELCRLFSSFMMSFFIRSATNKTLTLKRLVEHNETTMTIDVDDYAELMKTPNVEDDKFDIVQYHKTLNYRRDYLKMIDEQAATATPTKRKIMNETLSTNNQVILAIADYDKSGMFAYGSSSYKLTFELINETDLNDYLETMKKPPKPEKLSEAEYEELIFSNQIKYKRAVVAKFVSLHDVPTDFVHKFINDYDGEFNVYLDTIRGVEYMIIDDLEMFKTNFSDFLLAYMNI